jgi:geranylgeranyl pyrophosphate synthase
VNGDVGARLAHPSNQTCGMLVSSTTNICKGQANLLKRSERAASVRTELKIVYKKSSQLHNSSFRQAVVTSEKKNQKIFK